MKNSILKTLTILCVSLMLLVNTSCEDLLSDPILNNNTELKLGVSNSEVILDERTPNENLTFNWTTGTNQGTNASINYVLQIDKEGNNFANPLDYEIGKNKFLFSLNWSSLNYILLNTFGIKPGIAQKFEARITATVASEGIKVQQSTVPFTVTPYLPVSKELYITGSATPVGWDISKALPLTLSTTTPGLFVYQGQLNTGTFKLPVSQNGCFCQDFYTKSPTDAGKIVYNIGGSGQDLQWQITQAGQYKVTVDLLNLTINIESILGPAFSEIWIVGDATPSGWDVNNPKSFTQSKSNPFIFTYEANLTQGNFKILAGTKGDWCGEWYRPLVDGQSLSSTNVAQNSGCTVDNKWSIGAGDVGRYKITLNTQTNTISIKKINLYLIGDGGSNGWNIGDPSPMTYTNGVFVYNGALGSSNATGEFKIAKFKGDWCEGDWINPATPNQSISNVNYIQTNLCDGPDNKWKLKTGEAGNYKISINLDTNTMTIVHQ